MRSLIMLSVFLTLYACVQDEGKIDSGSVSDNGTTTGSTTGGSTTGGTSGGTPTDPLYTKQWHLNNTGQDVGSYVNLSLGIDTTPTSGVDINAEEVHDNGIFGAGVKVVISDSGTDYTHPDLSTNFIAADQRNYSFLDPSRWDLNADSYPSGNEAHGTAVAGIVAMEGWNDIGGRGVAPSAQFTAFKFVLDYTAVDHEASNLDKTIHQLNADYDIFNFSYGFGQCGFYNNYDDELIDALDYGVTTLRSGKGAIYVQSAGNNYLKATCSENPDYFFYLGNTNATASLSVPHKIVTAAVNADGVVSSYSTPGSGVWISGFGGEGMYDINGQLRYVPAITTADIQDCSSGFSFRDFINKIKNPFNAGYDRVLNPYCDYTNEMNGTSSAAPIVSGTVALMLEANPALTWRDVKYILARTATPPNDFDPFDPILNTMSHPNVSLNHGAYVFDYKWIQNAANIFFSNTYGYGIVDADAAVSMAQGWAAGTLGTYVKTETAGVWDHSSAVVVPIPDADLTTPATSTIAAVASLTIESVQVRLRLSHPNPEQLAVHLISPSGTESRLVLVDSGIVSTGSPEFYFLSNAFLDEDSGGTWTIQVYDPSDIPPYIDPDDGITIIPVNDTGSITSWAINIHGHP